MKSHKSYLCTGEMQWTKVAGRFGIVSAWKCLLCGQVLRSGVHSLHHKGVRMKNLRNKKRDVNNPYEVYYTEHSLLNDYPEVHHVLKHYQSPEAEAKNPYAIVLAAYDGAWETDEVGHDIYLSELKQRARLVWSDKRVDGNPAEANDRQNVLPAKYRIPLPETDPEEGQGPAFNSTFYDQAGEVE